MFCPDSCDSLISCMVAMWSSERANLNVIPLDTMITYVMLHLRGSSSIVKNLKCPLQAEMRWATKFRQVKGKLSRHNTKKLHLQWAGSRFLGLDHTSFLNRKLGTLYGETCWTCWQTCWQTILLFWWTLSWSSQNQCSCDLCLFETGPYTEDTERAFFQNHPQPLHLSRRHMFRNLKSTANFKPWRTQDDPLSQAGDADISWNNQRSSWDNLRWKQSQDWNFLRCLWHSSRRPVIWVISTSVIGIYPKGSKSSDFYSTTRESNLAQKKSLSKQLWKQ